MKPIKEYLEVIHWYAPLLLLPLLIYFGQHWGVIGILGVYLCWAIYRVWRVRHMVIEQKEYLETLIWGKPLKDEYWSKEEKEAFKNAKLKEKYRWGFKHK